MIYAKSCDATSVLRKDPRRKNAQVHHTSVQTAVWTQGDMFTGSGLSAEDTELVVMTTHSCEPERGVFPVRQVQHAASRVF